MHTHTCTRIIHSLAARDSFKCKSLQPSLYNPIFFGKREHLYLTFTLNLPHLSLICFKAPIHQTHHLCCHIKSFESKAFFSDFCLPVLFAKSRLYEYYRGKTFHTWFSHLKDMMMRGKRSHIQPAGSQCVGHYFFSGTLPQPALYFHSHTSVIHTSLTAQSPSAN